MYRPNVKNVGIETTTICNAKCDVCPRTHFFDGKITTMPLELFERIVLDLHQNCLPQFLIFGGMGDASCDKKLLERLRFCREHTPELTLVVASNMAVWKGAYSEAIVEEGLLDVLRASVFAVSEDCSIKAYGKADQGRIACEKMAEFVEANERHGHPVQTGLYTLSGEGFEDDIQSLKDQFWDRVDEFEVWQPHSWSNAFPDLRTAQAERRTCKRVDDFEVMIRVNGDVCACSMDFNSTLVYGNLARQTIEEVITGQAYQDFVRLNQSGEIETCKTCNGCTFLNADEEGVLVDSKPRDHGPVSRVSFFERNELAR